MTQPIRHTKKRVADGKGMMSAQGEPPVKLLVAMTGKVSAAKTASGDEPVFAYIASLPQPQRGSAERIDVLAAKSLPGVPGIRRLKSIPKRGKRTHPEAQRTGQREGQQPSLGWCYLDPLPTHGMRLHLYPSSHAGRATGRRGTLGLWGSVRWPCAVRMGAGVEGSNAPHPSATE